MSNPERQQATDELLLEPPGNGGPLVVECVQGKSARKRVLLTGSLVVGSDAGSDLVLDDGAVSRRHLSLRRTSRGVEVIDLGSANGTFYLGARVERVRLPPGSFLELGRSVICVRPGDPLDGDGPSFEKLGVVGSSHALKAVLAFVSRVAPTPTSVLLMGETGVGKDVIAQVLHRLSPRAKKPFVVLQCAAVNRELIEATLFGYEKGAFTGAVQARPGLLQAAEGGTLYLDEVGELPLELQPVLLRMLDAQTYRPVGAEHELRADVRIVASSRAPLEERVAAGQFRADLYFRLAVFAVEVPPLRVRAQDIRPLARHFARAIGRAAALPADLMERLEGHSWPGNVRELKNVVERYVRVGEDELAIGHSTVKSFDEAQARVVEQFQRNYLSRLLEETNGNVTEAAKRAAVSRARFYRMLKVAGIKT